MLKSRLPVRLPESIDRRYVAAALSVFFGGGGHLYLGQQKKGLLIVGVAVLLAPLGVGLLLIPLGMYDAYVIGGRVQRGKRVGAWEFFWHPEDGGPAESTWRVLHIVATDRSEQPLGSDERVIDNSKSSVHLTRNLRLQKEWSKSYRIEYERAYRERTTTDHKVTEYLGTRRTAEKLLRTKYGIAERERQQYEEMIALKVAPYKKVRLCLQWKQIMQNGVIVLGDQHGEQANVPFSVVIGLTFDQAQLDES